jgi:hypothetical protein
MNNPKNTTTLLPVCCRSKHFRRPFVLTLLTDRSCASTVKPTYNINKEWLEFSFPLQAGHNSYRNPNFGKLVCCHVFTNSTSFTTDFIKQNLLSLCETSLKLSLDVQNSLFPVFSTTFFTWFCTTDPDTKNFFGHHSTQSQCSIAF